MSKIIFIAAVVIFLIGIAAWLFLSIYQETETGNQFETEVANPASAYCESLGGTVEFVETEEGQIGMCSLPDGRVCEEWKLYRNECQ